MPEVNLIAFSYKEVAEALLRKEGIHEGLWGIYIEFGISALNIKTQEGGDLTPAAIVPIQKIGLQRFPEASNLTVDAAEVNPAPKGGQKEAETKATK